MDSPFIFIGSTHSFLDDFLKQKEIITLIKPEFVLSEELEDLELDSEEKFKNILKKRHFSNMTSFDEVKELISFCFNKEIKLIGIDFHNFGFNVILQGKLKIKKSLQMKKKMRLIE